jgi:hypothetical protein
MQETKRTDWGAALLEIKWKRNREWTRTISYKLKFLTCK